MLIVGDMNKQNHQNTTYRKLGTPAIIGLTISLIIISLFPIYITFTLERWPLETSVIILDIAYLIILAGYFLVLTGRNRSKWLVTTMATISIIGVAILGWLIVSLASFSMS